MENDDILTAEKFAEVVDFDPDASWAEYELKAAVLGIPCGMDFCRWTLALTKAWPWSMNAVAEGIMYAAPWNCFKSDPSLVEDICALHDARFSAGGSDIVGMAGALGAAFSSRPPQLPPARPLLYGKYMLLEAVEKRFPLLPVSYYARRAAFIHSTDERLAVWIRQRLKDRADAAEGEAREKFRKIYDSMAAEFVNRHFTAAVFMK